jgi:hypothetical protein
VVLGFIGLHFALPLSGFIRKMTALHLLESAKTGSDLSQPGGLANSARNPDAGLFLGLQFRAPPGPFIDRPRFPLRTWSEK